jgi:hypothetical protein
MPQTAMQKVAKVSQGRSRQNGRRQRTKRPTGTPKSMPKAAPKNRSKKVKKAMAKMQAQKSYSSDKSLNTIIAKETTFRARAGCLSPNEIIITLSFANSWQVIIDTIDQFLQQAQIEKPQMFQRANIDGSATLANIAPPTVEFIAARAAWFMAAYSYLVRIGVVIGANVSQVQVIPGITLPNGLAKFIQHFAPYYDTVTGTCYKFALPLLDTTTYNVYPAYPDISQAITQLGTIATVFNARINAYLIHPCLYVDGTNNNTDFATATGRINPTYGLPSPNTPTNLSAYVQTNLSTNTTIKNNINKLYNGVDPFDILRFAPDASFYAQMTSEGSTCPCPNTNNIMTLIGPQLLADNAQADAGVGYPFIKAFPPIGLNKPGSIFTLPAQYALAYRKLYAVLSGQVTKYVPRATSLSQLRLTQSYGTLKTFEVTGVQIAYPVIAERITEYLQNLNGNGNIPTVMTLFGLIQTFWCEIISRVASYDWIADTNNAYSGYAMGSNSTMKLPLTLASMISAVGPIVVNGSLYIPYFSSIVTTWYNSVNAGNWTTSPNGNASTVQTQMFYSTGQSVPIIDAAGAPIQPLLSTVFTVGSPLYAEYFQELAYQNFAENWSQAVQPSKNILGAVPLILGGIVLVLDNYVSPNDALTVTLNTGNVVMQRRVRSAVKSVFANTCITHFDATRIAILGLVSNISLANNVNFSSAQSILCSNNPIIYLSQVQLALSGTGNDISKGVANALARNKTIKFKDSMTQQDKSGETPYEALQGLLVAELQSRK